MFYILNDELVPVKIPDRDLTKGARWMGRNRQEPKFTPGKTVIVWTRHHNSKKTHCLVSTVFLCIDHNFGFKGPPVLFETMTFGDILDNQMQDRYCSWPDAVKGHIRVVESVLNRLHKIGIEPEITEDLHDVCAHLKV